MSRDWCWTAWELPKPDYDKCRYVCWGEERCPTTNKLHYQGFIIFNRTHRIPSAKRILGGGQLNPTGLANFAPGFNRGNAVMYIDQDLQKGETVQQAIVNVMNRGSCKMIPARSDQYTKVMYRKKGVPEWGCCDRNIDEDDRQVDPWFGSIEYLGNNATTTNQAGIRPLWFYTVTYKILFRGRNFVVA